MFLFWINKIIQCIQSIQNYQKSNFNQSVLVCHISTFRPGLSIRKAEHFFCNLILEKTAWEFVLKHNQLLVQMKAQSVALNLF